MPIYTFIRVYFRYHQNTAANAPPRVKERKGGAAGQRGARGKSYLWKHRRKALTNRPLPDGTEERLRSRLEGRRTPAVHRGLRRRPAGSYDDSLLAVTDRRVLYTEEDGGFAALPYTEIEEAAVKRMYGNARLTIRKKSGGTIRAVRFTYAVASLCDMAAAFINNVAGGCSPDGERRGGGGLRPHEAGLSQVRAAAHPRGRGVHPLPVEGQNRQQAVEIRRAGEKAADRQLDHVDHHHGDGPAAAVHHEDARR